MSIIESNDIATRPLPQRTIAMRPPSERRPTGFATIIETDLPLAELHRALSAIAAESAFRLADLDELGRTDGRAPRSVEASFELTATAGVVGDSQIFALLREIGCRHRWSGVRKRVSI